jgi:hypothetical protein
MDADVDETVCQITDITGVHRTYARLPVAGHSSIRRNGDSGTLRNTCLYPEFAEFA